MNKTVNFNDVAKRNGQRKTVLNVIIYTLLGVWALAVLFPFYWMIITALKSYASYNSELVPTLFPTNPTLDNFVTAFTATDVELARAIGDVNVIEI